VNIVLVGMMGSGKTAVGRALARLTGRRFTDTDALVEAQAGRGTAEIFAAEGEAAFRLRESAVIAQVVLAADQVIATGGGAVIAPNNREALRRHDREWAEQVGLDGIPAMPDAASGARILALLGGAVFRVKPGEYRPGDERNGSYRHFADAEHLMRFNCRRVSGDLEAAREADVLFYRQLEPKHPFHAMVVTEGRVVYHTGPEGGWAGEVRRLEFDELRRHRQARWRPVGGNANYLGVFRWKILERG